MDTDAIRTAIDDQIGAAKNDISALVRTLIDQNTAPRSVVVDFRDVKREIDGRTHAQFDRLVKLAGARNRNGHGHNILIVGPAGCGKTHCVAQVADALGLSFGFLSLSGGISESHLIGRYAPTGENGRFEYRPAPFVEFYRNGGVFLLDEIDAADPNVLVVVNAALANGHLRLPDGTVVDRHADFVCVAAANTFGTGADRQYVGRNQLDAATLDRFAACRLSFDYDTELERDAGRADVCEWAHGLRESVRKAQLRRIVSTRWILDASDLVDAGASTLDECKRSLLLDWTDSELSACGVTQP